MQVITNMTEDFTTDEIFTSVRNELNSSEVKPEKEPVPFIWILKPLQKDIISALKSSIYASDINDRIFYWHGNSKKYFVTDKYITYSISIYKINYKEEIDPDDLTSFLYTEYETVADLEAARNQAKLTGEPFACWQLRRLKPDNKQLELKVMHNRISDLEEMGYKVSKRFNDHTCKYDYFVRIAQSKFIDIVVDEKPVIGENKRNGKAFVIKKDGETFAFANKKECYEKMFKGIVSEITFKRATVGKVAGNLITIKKKEYKVVAC